MYQISSQYVKNKKFHFGVIFGGALGGGRLDCGQYKILTDPRNGLKNPNKNFSNDRSHRQGGVWWQTDRWQPDRQKTDRQIESLCALWYLRLLRRLDKVDVQFPYILVWKLYTQACEIVARTKRKPCKKFQVVICKTKKDRSSCVCTAPSHDLWCSKGQEVIYKIASRFGYVQNLKKW